MGKILLKDIKIFAYHGCLVEEGKIGSDYKVDLTVETNLLKSSLTDNLEDTVDYVHLNKIVTEEMAIRSKLLETVANRIIHRIFIEIPMVDATIVAVSKMNPPIGGDVKKVTIVMSKKRELSS